MKPSHTRYLNYIGQWVCLALICVISTDFYWLLLADNSSAEKNEQPPKQNPIEASAPWTHVNRDCWFVGSWWAPLPGTMSWDQMHLVRKWSDGPTAENRGLPLASSPWRLHCQFCLWRPSHSHVFPLVLEGTGEFAIAAYDFWVDAIACCEIQDHAARPPAARCQLVCRTSIWTRAKRLFGHRMLKPRVGGRDAESLQCWGPQQAGTGCSERGKEPEWPAWMEMNSCLAEDL